MIGRIQPEMLRQEIIFAKGVVDECDLDLHEFKVWTNILSVLVKRIPAPQCD